MHQALRRRYVAFDFLHMEWPINAGTPTLLSFWQENLLAPSSKNGLGALLGGCATE